MLTHGSLIAPWRRPVWRQAVAGTPGGLRPGPHWRWPVEIVGVDFDLGAGPGSGPRIHTGASSWFLVKKPGGFRVPTVKTPSTDAQMLALMLSAIGQGDAGRPAANILVAQAGVETADWRAMHGNNPGNVTPSQSYQGPWMDQGLTYRYIVYSTLGAGVRAMVDWMRTRNALQAALNGDVGSFVGALQAGCYLGCIGNTDSMGHTVSSDDYANYAAGINARVGRLNAVQLSNVWRNVAIGAGVAGAVGAGVAAAVFL